MHNGGQTACSKMIFDSGSSSSVGVDDNATADPTSIGIWASGEAAAKTDLFGGKAEARTGFLNTGTDEGQGVALSDFNLKTSSVYSLVFANSGLSLLTAVHGGGDGAGYADSSELGLTLTGNNLPDTTIAYDDPSKLAAVHCANNNFATGFCGNLLTHTAAGGLLPSVSGSGSMISGNDGAGRIALATALASVTVTFAQQWASKPVCFAQDETTLARNPVVVSSIDNTSVTFKPVGPTSFGATDNISYQCTGFQ
jgi:hypothetical protein